MDARRFRPALLAATLLVSMGASYRTQNFVVHTPNPQHAAELCKAAEQYRHDLAVSWLGRALPDWRQPCPITVRVGANLGAGGATQFVFLRGEAFDWRMTIQGSYERVLDSVLPHEITHMIFATHFGQPLPRWADEGGATSVEHESEKAKHRRMLVQFLRTNRGIAFNRMFAMKEYPRDMMPLYAQGYSLAEFLLQQGGRRKYVAFVGDGLKTSNWPAAIKKHYGIDSLGALQNTWLAWVRQGSPALVPAPPHTESSPAVMLASNPKRPRPEPNLVHHQPRVKPSDDEKAAEEPAARPIATAVAAASPATPYRPGSTATPGVVWTAPLAPIPSAQPRDEATAVATTAAPRRGAAPRDGWHAPGAGSTEDVYARTEGPVYSQVTRPQPPQKVQETVVAW